MGPKDKYRSASDFFQRPLLELINHKHPLVKLAELIDWRVFKTRWKQILATTSMARHSRAYSSTIVRHFKI